MVSNFYLSKLRQEITFDLASSSHYHLLLHNSQAFFLLNGIETYIKTTFPFIPNLCQKAEKCSIFIKIKLSGDIFKNINLYAL